MDYSGIEALRGAKPWFVMSAILQLEDGLVQPDWRAFEWGSGGSTLWLSQWCESVVSIEHDREWYRKAWAELVHYGIDNVLLLCSGLDITYEEDIKLFTYDFDLIFVDGRKRAACIAHAVDKLRPSGILVLDNSEREQYQAAIAEHLAGWERWDHLNPSGRYAEWMTTIWRKP